MSSEPQLIHNTHYVNITMQTSSQNGVSKNSLRWVLIFSSKQCRMCLRYRTHIEWSYSSVCQHAFLWDNVNVSQWLVVRFGSYLKFEVCKMIFFFALEFVLFCFSICMNVCVLLAIVYAKVFKVTMKSILSMDINNFMYKMLQKIHEHNSRTCPSIVCLQNL